MYNQYVFYIHICSAQWFFLIIYLTAQLLLFLNNDISRNTYLIYWSSFLVLNFVLEYVHSPSKCILFALVFRKVKPILSIKHLNSLVSNDWTIRMTFRLLHLICNSQEHAKHFFNFMIDKETEKQHKSDKNHIPVQIKPSEDIPYVYVACKHQYCLLLGKHINSDESSPVPPTSLNALQ